ncbi:MAG: DUF2341 domain-containing protein [Euryarchaeota archaeon]|nr:DUF2341 domain-containing protein [Euryarchaeota archaeon]
MEKNKILKIAAIGILFIFLFTSAAQASYQPNKVTKIVEKASSSFGGNGKGIITWQDEFDNATKIDPSPPGSGASDNYVVANSKVTMVNTYPVWTDPAWTKMKPITITNTAGQILYNTVIYFAIPHVSGMQSAYQDIRFKHENNPTIWLDYWIERYNATVAHVWVEIPTIPIGTSTMYLFYGNPSATSQSNFDNVFSWQVNWGDDEKITNHANNEGTWDPDVAYGNGEFLVAWEEGQAWWPPYTWGFKQEIRASMYDLNGSKLVDDKQVFNDGTTYYRNENPSIDYGGGKYFVAWEHYDTVANPSVTTEDIKARTVVRNGDQLQLGSVIDVCIATNCQADANVQYDSVNNRFCVVWEDARNGDTNYNIYGRLYDTNGNPIGSEKGIATGTYSQCEPWVAFDPIHEHYMIVWEEGITANNGPFSLKAGLFDESLNQIGSTITIATGSDSVDYNFPCVEFSEETQRFLVTWNNDDISSGNWWGNTWGKIFDASGSLLVNTFQISSGEFVRTDIVPYLSSSFFVSFNSKGASGSGLIWGKIVSFDGIVSTSDIQLSSSGNALADWANLAAGDGKIFTSWEDIRLVYPSPWDDNPDVYGNMWWLQMTGSSVTYVIGTEKQIVLTAHITSVKITPTNLNKWNIFDATYTDGTITFDILDGTTGAYLLQGVTPGTNLQGLTAQTIRLKATFTRANPSTTPKLDKWSVKYEQNDPPNTPSNPSPANGVTDVSVTLDLSWTGGDPNGDPVTYDVYFGTASSPPKVVSNQSGTTYDPGTMNSGTMYYWKIVAWDSHGASAAGPVWHFTTHNDPPNTPSSPNPANGATGVSINADLSWTGGDQNPGDIVTYDVYFGTTTPPTTKVSANQSGTSYDPGTMSYSIPYYWKIVAWDNHGASTAGPIWNFITENRAPTVSYLNPTNHQTSVSTTADLNWTGGDPDPGDTVTYDVYFGTASSPPKVVSNQSGTSYNPGTMNYNTKYYWKIVAWDNHGASTAGPIWDFTTCANGPPNTPSNPSPSNGATGVSVTSDLSWTGGDPNGDPVTYDIYFGTSNPPPLVNLSHPDTSYNPGTMDSLTTYYWKIVAWDNYGLSAEGPIWHFTTVYVQNNPPNTPSSPIPTNHATDVSIDTDISWTGGDPDPYDTVTYDIYFGTTNPPPKIFSNQSATTYDPGTLAYGTIYHWKIVAWDNHGASAASSVWDFTTHNDPPNTPSNPSPSPGATGVIVTATLSWTGGDPNPGDVVTYDVYFGTTSPPTQVVWGQSGTSYDPSGDMNYNTHYYWKIVAWDNHGASTVGPIWDFTTENRAPYTPSDPDPDNGETNVDVNHDLSWTGGDPDGDPVTYDIYFGDYSPPPKIEENWPSTTYDQGTMSGGPTPYYWKIVAHDNHGGSTEGPTWQFTTEFVENQPPYKPNNPSPTNGATGVLVTANLSWTGGDPDNDPVTYDVYFGTTNPPTTKVSDHQSSTTYDPPGAMSYNTVYYWRIEAWDDQNAHSYGEGTWSFTTEQEQVNEAPYLPTINGPFLIIIIGQPYSFTFQAIDPDDDDITYIVNWGDGPDELSGPVSSGESVTLIHTWQETQFINSIQITAKAEDEHGAQGPTATYNLLGIKDQVSQQSQQQSQPQSQQQQQQSQPSSQPSGQMILRSIIRQTTNT